MKNDGSVPALADWYDRVYLSDDQEFGSGDRYVADQNAAGQSPLAPGATYTVNRTVTPSNVTAGPKYLLFVADSNQNQGETDETDNLFAVPIEFASADLVLTDASGPSQAAANEPISISRTIRNDGVGPAPAQWTDAAYLSPDSILDASDTLIGTNRPSGFIPLAVGASFTAPIPRDHSERRPRRLLRDRQGRCVLRSNRDQREQ